MPRTKDRIQEMAARRKSVAYLSPRDSARLPHLERDMLIEDVDHTIMPLGSYGRTNSGYNVSVNPPSDEASACLQTAFTSEECEYDLASSLAMFIRRAANVILYQGEAFYEVVFDGNEKPKGFWLAPLPLGEVKMYRRVVRQMIPPDIQLARGLKHAYVEMPASDVVHFSFPASLGGKQGIAQLTAGLEHLGGSLPQFADSNFGKLREVGFEVAEYHELRDCALGQITAKLGWHARSLMERRTTEIYTVYRKLKFNRSLALVREHILNYVNRSIEPALRRIGLKGVLSVSGLPTSEDMEAKLKELIEGKLSFADALAYVRRF